MIGGFATCLDIATFAALTDRHVIVEVAVTIGAIVSTAVSFCFNKYLNFRNHDRSVPRQFRTYVAVCVASYAISVAIVSFLTHTIHLSPFVSKVISVALVFPFNFLCHNFLTFAGGIRARFYPGNPRLKANL
jgi:putative flippase GtrA